MQNLLHKHTKYMMTHFFGRILEHYLLIGLSLGLGALESTPKFYFTLAEYCAFRIIVFNS